MRAGASYTAHGSLAILTDEAQCALLEINMRETRERCDRSVTDLRLNLSERDQMEALERRALIDATATWT